MLEGHIFADLFYHGTSVSNVDQVMILRIKAKMAHRSLIGHVLDSDSTMLAEAHIIRSRTTE